MDAPDQRRVSKCFARGARFVEMLLLTDPPFFAMMIMQRGIVRQACGPPRAARREFSGSGLLPLPENFFMAERNRIFRKTVRNTSFELFQKQNSPSPKNKSAIQR